MNASPPPHAHPGYCHHFSLDSARCDCPEYDDEGPDPAECGTCDHSIRWHLPPLRLTHDEGRAIKSRGEEALERCKNKLKGSDGFVLTECPCPVFTPGVGQDCGLCGCRKGWHKWKDLGSSAQQLPPTSPTTSSAASSSDGSFGHSPHPIYSSPTRPINLQLHRTSIPPASPFATSSFLRGGPSSPPDHLADPAGPSDFRAQGSFSNSPLDGSSPPETPVEETRARLDKGKNVVRDDIPRDPTPVLRPLDIPSATEPASITANLHQSSSDATGAASALRPRHSFAGARAPEDEFYGPEPVQQIPSITSPGRSTAPRRVRRQGSRDLLDSAAPAPPRPPARSLAAEPTPIAAPTPRSITSPAIGDVIPDPLREPAIHRLPAGASSMPASSQHAAVAQNFPVEVIAIDRTISPTDQQEILDNAGDLAHSYRDREQEGRPRVSSVSSQGSNASQGGALLNRRPSDLVQEPAPAAGGPAKIVFREYETKSKNMTFSVSPGLETGRFKPGQIFHLRVKLGPKLSLANFERIEVSLVGNTLIQGEPPDNHDFLVLTTSLLPLQEGVQREPGDRVFTWTMTLPYDQNCMCRDEPLPLPTSYTHHFFASRYRFKLSAKKVGRFNLGSTEKSEFLILVDAPFIEVPDNIPTPSNLSTRGVDGPWRTTTHPKLIKITDQQASIISSELAYQVYHPAESPSVVHIPYRISLNLGSQPLDHNGQDLNHAVLQKFAATVRLSLSRKIQIYKSGKGSGNARPTDLRDLGMLLVTFRDRRGRSYLTSVEGKTLWRCEGQIEVSKSEARSLTNCNTKVSYVLSAKIGKSVGFTHDFEVYYHGLNLELPTTNAELPAGLPRTDSDGARRSSESLEPVPTNPPGRARTIEAFTPLPPVASGSGLPRFQLTDGPRPPSEAGFSVFRLPRWNSSQATISDEEGVGNVNRSSASSGDEPLPDLLSPPTSPDLQPIPVSVVLPEPAPPANTGRLDLPPDFEDEFPPGHEPTPPYSAYEDGEVSD